MQLVAGIKPQPLPTAPKQGEARGLETKGVCFLNKPHCFPCLLFFKFNFELKSRAKCWGLCLFLLSRFTGKKQKHLGYCQPLLPLNEASLRGSRGNRGTRVPFAGLGRAGLIVIEKRSFFCLLNATLASYFYFISFALVSTPLVSVASAAYAGVALSKDWLETCIKQGLIKGKS